MWGAAPRGRRYALAAALAVVLFAATGGQANAGLQQAPDALPQLWGVEVGGKTLRALDRPLLRRMRAARVTLVAAPGLTARQRRRLERTAARWSLSVFRPRHVSSAMTLKRASSVCASRKRTEPGARCALMPSSLRQARLFSRGKAIDVVVTRVRGARSFRRLDNRARSTRMVGVLDLTNRSYRAARWRSLMRMARGGALLDLAVRPAGPGQRRALTRFLRHLRPLAPVDRRPPTRPRNPVVAGAAERSVSVSWNASRDDRGVAGYGLYRNGAYVGTSSSPPATWGGLRCSSYVLAVDAVDRAGNRSAKSVLAASPACSRPPSADDEPPSVPQGMAFPGKTKTSVSLVWDASTDNVGVAGYGLYRSNVRVASTDDFSYTYTGLACGTSYSFALEAYDAAGNASNRAEATGVTSTQPCDSPPPPPPPPPPPGDEPSPQLFLSTSGSDGNPCTAVAPCASFDRAYRVAGPGQVVEVGGGTYPGQSIRAVAGRTGPNVVFRPAAGARVVLGGITFGANGDPGLGPDHITVRGMEMTYKSSEPGASNQRGIFVGPGSTFITLEHMDAGNVHTWFADHVTIKGGDYGPCHAVWGSPNVCGNSKLDVSNNVTIDGARFHDYRFDETCFTVAGADCHWECLYVNGGENVTIKNSRFYRCAIFDIFTTISGPDAGKIGHKNLTIENNWFATPWTESPSGGSPSRPTAVSLAWCQNSSFGYKNVLVRFNSFQRNTMLQLDHNPTCVFDNIQVIGNVMMWDGCQSRWTFAYNVWSTAWRTGSCSPTDRILGDSFPYVNGGGNADMDYHLAAESVADDLVPASLGCPATDIDEQPRPEGARCDAGADER